MKDVTRRDVVKAVAALTAGAAGAATAAAQEPPPPDLARLGGLAAAQAHPQSYLLGPPVTFRVKTDGRSRDLTFPQTLDDQGRRVAVRLKSGKMAVLLADAGVDAVTRRGGLRWEFFGETGVVEMGTPGRVILVVREDDTVRCYTMSIDFRC